MKNAIQDPQRVMFGVAAVIETRIDAANGGCVGLIAALSLFGFIAPVTGADWIMGMIIGCVIFLAAISTALLLGRRVLQYSWSETKRIIVSGVLVSGGIVLFIFLKYSV